MKCSIITLTAILVGFLSTGERIWAQDSGGSISAEFDSIVEQERAEPLLRLNPQLGVSSFESSQTRADQQLSGGLTLDIGRQGSRRVETGLLFLPMTAKASTVHGDQTIRANYWAVPVMAKFRLVSTHAQSWYIKAGGLPAFLFSTNQHGTANPEILGSVGIGARFPFIRAADLVVEATYNHSIMRALNEPETHMDSGILAMAGLSFRL